MIILCFVIPICINITVCLCEKFNEITIDIINRKKRTIFIEMGTLKHTVTENENDT